MKRWIMAGILLILLAVPVQAAEGRTWDISENTLQQAMAYRAESAEEEPDTWLRVLALAAAEAEGDPSPGELHRAALRLEREAPDPMLLREAYWGRLRLYRAALGSVSDAVLPVAAGYRWVAGEHSAETGCTLLVADGAPVVAMEGGLVERIGTDRDGTRWTELRSADGCRLYRYAGLRPAEGSTFSKGSRVEAGTVLGLAASEGKPLGSVQLQLTVTPEGVARQRLDPSLLFSLLEDRACPVVCLGEGQGWRQVVGTAG